MGNATVQNVDIDSLSAEQVEAILNKKRDAEKKAYQAKKAAYEQGRNDLINRIGTAAQKLSELLAMLKGEAFVELADFREQMLEYGDLRGKDKNKGSFEIKNGFYKVQFSTQVVKKFDERASLAETKMSDFLSSFVKKRDAKLYNVIVALLKRNEETGDFDIDLINRLYKMEEQFDDPRWRDAIKLFKEAYAPTNSKQYVRVFKAVETGGWEPLVLDMASIKPAPYEKKK